MIKFNYKAEGRIFTDTEENIDKIKTIIREINDFEYGYLPDGLITVLPTSGFNFETIYNGKFDDIDLDELNQKCKEKNIPMWFLIAEKRGYDSDWGEYCSVDGFQLNRFIWQLYLDGFRTKEQLNEYYKIR